MSTVASPIAGAGSSVDSGSPEAIDTEVLDTPSGTEPDASATNTPEPEGGEGDESHQPEPGTEGAEVDGGQAKEDGRLIPKWVRDMKESNPEGYKAAKAAFFSLKERETIHPTVQAARMEHELVESLGGQEGVNTLQENAGFFRDASSQFLKGDPAFVKDLWAEDPIAAALHVSPMLEEFRAKDMQGYKSTIARIWANDFKQLNFAPALKDLRAAIANKDMRAIGEISQSIQEWHDSIIDEAQKAEDPRVKTLLAERNKGLETRQKAEQAEFLKGYRTEATNAVVSQMDKVFDSFFRGRKISPDDRRDLQRDALSIANRAVEGDKAFIEQRDNHLKRGDSKAALRLTTARFQQEFTTAVKTIARRYGLVSGQPTQVPAQQKQNPGGPAKGPAPAQGFVAVNERPPVEQIDSRRTTPTMIVAGRAVLHDGRKVDWSRLKQRKA